MDPCAIRFGRSRTGRRDRVAGRSARSRGRCVRSAGASASGAEQRHQLRNARRAKPAANAQDGVADGQLDDGLLVYCSRRRQPYGKQPGRTTRDLAALGALAQAVKPATKGTDVEPVLRAVRLVRLAATLELLHDLHPLLATPPHWPPPARPSRSSRPDDLHPAPGRTVTTPLPEGFTRLPEGRITPTIPTEIGKETTPSSPP